MIIVTSTIILVSKKKYFYSIFPIYFFLHEVRFCSLQTTEFLGAELESSGDGGNAAQDQTLSGL